MFAGGLYCLSTSLDMISWLSDFRLYNALYSLSHVFWKDKLMEPEILVCLFSCYFVLHFIVGVVAHEPSELDPPHLGLWWIWLLIFPSKMIVHFTRPTSPTTRHHQLSNLVAINPSFTEFNLKIYWLLVLLILAARPCWPIRRGIYIYISRTETGQLLKNLTK